MPRPASGIDRRIVKAARHRFLARGVDGASLREIAQRARTSIGMVYYYFPTKDDLFLAVVEDVYETILSLFEAALAPDVPVPTRIARLYERMGSLDEDQLAVMRLVIREALTSPARLGRLAERFQRGHIPLVLALVRDGQQAGVFSPTLPPWLVMVSTMAMGALPQVAPRLLGLPAPGGDQRAGELAPLLVGLLLHGVGPGASPRT